MSDQNEPVGATQLRGLKLPLGDGATYYQVNSKPLPILLSIHSLLMTPFTCFWFS